MLIVYNSAGASLVSQRSEYSPAITSTGKLLDDASNVSVLAKYASENRRWSTETTTPFQRRRQLYEHGQGTETGPSATPLKNAQDYFITKRSGFPWSTIPDFVVGRAGVDNWLLVTALARRAAVVDASRTVTALHQVTSGYKPSAHFTQPTGDATVNYALAGREFDYSLGLTDCAPLETTPAPDSTLTGSGRQYRIDCDERRRVALRRRQWNRYCQRAYVKLRGLHRLPRVAVNSHRNKNDPRRHTVEMYASAIRPVG